MRALRRFLKYLKPYRRRCAYATLSMCAVALFNGTAVLLLKPIVDKVFIAKDFKMLRLAVLAVPILVALKTAASYAQNYLMGWLGQKVAQEIREDLFRHLHALPLDYFARHQSGEILARATSDLSAVQWALTSLPIYLIRDSMTVLVLSISLACLDLHVALLSLLGLPLVVFFSVILSKKMRSASRQSQVILEHLTQRFQESVQGMDIIKAFNYEDGLIEKFQDENHSFFVPVMRFLRATALAAPLMELCGGVIAALILYFGGSEVIEGRMTPGAFFAFLGAFFAAYAPIKNLARSNSELQRALASAERIFQLLDERPALQHSAKTAPFTELKQGIRFESVSFLYPGRQERALSDVDIFLPKNSWTVLVGPSGSGKTTLGRLLLGLQEPARGRILLDETPLSSLDPKALRARIGLVSHNTLLFNATVFENIALGQGVVTLGEVERVCRLTGAQEFIERLPEGYQTRLGESGLALSAGQRQKIGLARALIKNPPILILDEATSNLDAASEAEILETLEALIPGRTAVMISHNLQNLSRADRVLVFKQGRLVEAGSHASLLALGGFYRKLYEFQKAEPTALQSPQASGAAHA
ncbi:MAG: ABC transporter ATP-binding protein [Elusimicrobia bacterium]|nr:ABC transporter ATP-binding protein [Elusimicrobiota bacterium]